jgi:hypothetical protein
MDADPLPASRRVYQSSSRYPHIRVPMSEIALHPSTSEPPLTVYDSSGPCTDVSSKIDIERGLSRLREQWARPRIDLNGAVTQLAYARAGIITPKMGLWRSVKMTDARRSNTMQRPMARHGARRFPHW